MKKNDGCSEQIWVAALKQIIVGKVLLVQNCNLIIMIIFSYFLFYRKKNKKSFPDCILYVTLELCCVLL